MITLISMAIQLALAELRRNKMRSMLTMLGVIIGVGAVIAMVSIGQGASSSVQAQIASLGTNMILIFPGSTTQGGVRAGAGTVQTLTIEDAKALGRTVVENLFLPGNNPIGQIIRIKNIPFRIIGVLSPKGQTAYGSDQDDVALIPFTTAERRGFGAALTGRVGSIQVSALSKEAIQEATGQIREILRARHRLETGEEDDFTIRSLEDIAGTAQATTRVLTILLLC